MRRFDSPTATQRLSRMVQTEHGGTEASGAWSWQAPRSAGAGPGRLFSRKVRNVLGLELASDAVRLARVRRLGDRPLAVAALRSIPLTTNPLETADLGRRLRAEIKALCQGAEKPEIWAVAPLETTEMHLVNLPASVRTAGETTFYAVQEAKPFDPSQTVFDYQTIGPAADDRELNAERGGPGPSSAGTTGVLGVTADLAEVERLERAVAESGYRLAGLCPYPLAFQNLVQAGLVNNGGRALCRLFVSETFSRIDVFSGGGDLGLSRTIRSSISGMVDVLRARLPSAAGGDGPPEAERVRMDRNAAREVFFAMLGDRSPDSGPAAGLAPGQLLEVVEKPLQRLVWQVERTIEAYASKIDADPVAVLCVAGELGHSSLFRTYLASQIDLELSVQSEEALRSGGPFWPALNADFAGKSPPIGDFEPAIGIALSDLDRTPNFLFPFRDKIRRMRGRRIQKLVWVFLILCTLGTAAGYYWQRAEAARQTRTAERLERELGRRIARQGGLVVDRPLIELQVERLREERRAIRAIAERYRLPAVVGGLVLAAPGSVFFSEILADFPTSSVSDSPSGPSDRRPSTVVVRGHVLGGREEAESDLLRYLAVLKEEPMFPRPTLREKRMVDYYGDPALWFVIQVDFETASST